MICPNCNQPTNRMIYRAGGKACAVCWGLSEAGGVKLDGSLTRNSYRIREQQRRFEADIITPHIYDKTTKKMVPNPDFINIHTEKVGNFFKQGELEQAGYTKIGHVYKHVAETKQREQNDAAAGVTFKTPKG